MRMLLSQVWEGGGGGWRVVFFKHFWGVGGCFYFNLGGGGGGMQHRVCSESFRPFLLYEIPASGITHED